MLSIALHVVRDVACFVFGCWWGRRSYIKAIYPIDWHCHVEGCTAFVRTNSMEVLNHGIDLHTEETGHGKVEV